VREAASAIFEACTGSPPLRVRAQAGGLTNHVFLLEGREGSFVLRMDPSAAKLDEYRKERWAIDHARRMDVPAPNVIEVGLTPQGVSFMLARRERGRPATALRENHVVLRQLGQYARKLHQEALGSFGGQHGGETSPWQSWTDFLEHEFRLGWRLDCLVSLTLLDEPSARRVADLVLQLGAGREPRLNHGDLRLKNVLVDDGDRISAIIDWEFAMAGPAPEWDLALALHDLSIDEKDAFVDGYGLDHRMLVEMRPVLAALNMLHYAPFVDAAAREGEEQLARYRRRFARVYDLYSL
jgi:aminoglycoside phosphotransferase (APT) family kinase protein